MAIQHPLERSRWLAGLLAFTMLCLSVALAQDSAEGRKEDAALQDMQSFLDNEAVATAVTHTTELVAYCQRISDKKTGHITLLALKNSRAQLRQYTQRLKTAPAACRKVTTTTPEGEQMKQLLIAALDRYARALPLLLEATNSDNIETFKKGARELAAANTALGKLANFVKTETDKRTTSVEAKTGETSQKPAEEKSAPTPAKTESQKESLPEFPLELPKDDFDIEI